MWARKHNIKAMSKSIIDLREQGINSAKELNAFIEKAADGRQELQEKIKVIENYMKANEMKHIIDILKDI